MNNTYEINNSIVENKMNLTNKYIYNNNEINQDIFIFEIELIDNNNKSHFIRNIIKNRRGGIIVNNILYDEIFKYKILIININDMNNIIIMKGLFNNNNIIKNNIIINFLKSLDNSININYIL